MKVIAAITACITFSTLAAALAPALETDIFWGDTHVHTMMSTDAYIMGNRLAPQDAYRFAKGKEVALADGSRMKLRRRLDFLVVADHGENIGVVADLSRDDSRIATTEEGRRWKERIAGTQEAVVADPDRALLAAAEWFFDMKMVPVGGNRVRRSMWRTVVENSERANDPGRFTSLIGYEWTTTTPKWAGLAPGKMSNLHRVIVFRDGPDRLADLMPFTAADSDRPEELWKYLEKYESSTSGQALAIPHNSNLSAGLMFSLTDSGGSAIGAQYAKIRSHFEPLVEVTQIKGDSETHPELSTNDEFSSFEGYYVQGADYARADGQSDLAGSYIREGLKRGLKVRGEVGENPFQFGVIGSSDSHTSMTVTDESTFMGASPAERPSARRMFAGISEGWRMSASGYTAVWATENTREALFDAMKRKEVYASTGPRITVRFFGGWDYQEMDAYRPDLAKIGYSGGVPMGGDLASAPDGRAPRFLIRAVKDPLGANLDRVQVVKCQ